MGSVVRHDPMSGFKTTIYLAIGAVRPVGSTVTMDAPALKGATSITVLPLAETIEKGNWLLLKDADGIEYLLEVTHSALAGATSVMVAPIVKAIPDEASGHFPPELYDRSGVDVNRQTNSQNVLSLNTGGTEMMVLTTSNADISAAGYYHWWNPALRMCEKLYEEKRSFWVIVEYESPDPTLYSKGQVIYGRALIDSLPIASPADGFVSMDLTFKFTGQIITIPPVPIV